MIPGARALWTRWIVGKPGIHEFSGWGMTTNTFPPWFDPSNELAKDFLKAHNRMVELVTNGQFRLAQWDAVTDKEELLRGLMWRHYLVFWSARYAQAVGKNIAECGVCDGLTVYFAMTALKKNCKAFLYDAWEGMSGEYLLDSEKGHVGAYEYLDIEDTKKNLSGFDTVFIKGCIPESFKGNENPASVAWLHIDLNASLPTMGSLNYFFDRVSAGGIILFDDYAGRGFTDTKVAVDTFFSDKKGILLQVPTGQAMFFKQ
jgi:O-methyltransferase